MNKSILLIMIIIFTKFSFAQIELKGTMGINFISIPSAEDYINQNYAPDDEQLGTFQTAVIFTLESGYFIDDQFEMSIELPYQIYSYNTSIPDAGQYDLYFDSFLPSVMAYYVISGVGYNFKFGGGLGPRYVTVTEEKKWQGTSEEFTSIGFGGVIRAEGNTSLSENLFANIGFDARYDLNDAPENNDGHQLVNNVEDEEVNFNSFTLGVKLGISYLIR